MILTIVLRARVGAGLRRCGRRPPAGLATGPQSFYAVRSGALDDYGRAGRAPRPPLQGPRAGAGVLERAQSLDATSTRSASPATRTTRARVYLRMLRAFHAGVHRAGTGVRVVAGATAPVGLNDVYRTSPQRFARFLQRLRRGPLLRRLLAPPVHARRLALPGAGPAAQRPLDHGDAVQPAHAAAALPAQALLPHRVRLQHAGRPWRSAASPVSEREQARYLRQAYQVAASYPQVKLLVWFLLRDAGAGDRRQGCTRGCAG